MGALEGKVAVITGAGAGLGREHALLFAAEGARLVLNDLGDGVDDVAATIRDRGGEAVVVQADVSAWVTGEQLVAAAVESYGDVDIVVNNAGILRDAMSFSMTEEQFDKVVAVHLKGHFGLARAAAVHWREAAKQGVEKNRRLIHTASESGLYGGPAQANYGSAKAGIANMALTFARELGKYGVTSNAIAPRARTGLTEHQGWTAKPADPSVFDKWDPANVSPFVAYLASDAAQHINGHVFVVGGGAILLVERWPIAGSLQRDHRWTVDEIAASVGELFGTVDPGIPPFRTQTF